MDIEEHPKMVQKNHYGLEEYLLCPKGGVVV